MIITILSWCSILIIVSLLGLFASSIVERLFYYKIKYYRNIVLLGVVFATIYAELFSLFHGGGRLSIFILLIICLVSSIYYFKKHSIHILNFQKLFSSNFLIYILIFLLVTLWGAFITSMEPIGYDTSNYHIPSIRWIEEFGVVKGLGNLHCRFAYNSSFLCLQALFSFKWICGTSLHTVNGFVWCFFMLSCIFSLKIFETQRLCISDLLRLLCVVMLLRREELSYVCSPNTDFLPMCISLYIFIEWANLNENFEKNYAPYGILAILGLFAMSVKLSAAILVLFSAKPIILIIREKKYIDILKFLGMGIVVIFPYLARNIIISGYLLYPVAGLDIFNFDWEMPKSVVISDSVAIKVFARAWGSDYSFSDMNRTLYQWLKIWIEKSSEYFGIIVTFDTCLAVVMIIICFLILIKKKKIIYDISLFLMSIFGFLFLFITAPSIRFGRIWFYLVPILGIYLIYIFITSDLVNEWYKEEHSEMAKFFQNLIFCFVFFGIIMYNAIIVQNKYDNKIFIEPIEYSENGDDGDYVIMNGYKFYYSDGSDSNNLNGYEGFPGTECLLTLTRIEMRGNTLKDGFRVNIDNLKKPYNFQGADISEKDFEIMKLYRYYNLE